jgi:hypothetical protein
MTWSTKAPWSLVALGASLGLLACGLSFLARTHEARGERDESIVPTVLAGWTAEAASTALAPVGRSRERETGLTTRPGANAVPTAVLAPASITGRLLLDGHPPPEARILLRSEDGTSVGTVPVDHEGRFWLACAARAVQLSFELPPGGLRALVFPRLRVLLEPGRTTELELDWHPKHVNLRVVGDPSGWNRARVQVAGPDHETELETGDDGIARLGMVGEGRFTFRATQTSGRRGEAVLELDGDTELESVVIRVGDPP